jgi:23S rRNA (cytosine1962-C5)-methyltransferase
VFEDDDLLVVNKPAGLNTHASAPYAGEGIYDWLRHREPRWASLAIIHRLDKETSGVLVFAKSPRANRSLTEQFTQRQILKQYLLRTDRRPLQREFTAVSHLERCGARYVNRPAGKIASDAITEFKVIGDPDAAELLLEARPKTGRTHQIRAHAALADMPILGDVLYGGTPAPRVYLHAAVLTLRHPATGQVMTFTAPVEFQHDPRIALRAGLLDLGATNAFRLAHGAADDCPGWHADRLGDYVLFQSEELGEPPKSLVALLCAAQRQLGFTPSATYHKMLQRQARRVQPVAASPRLLSGQAAPECFEIRENGIVYELGFQEGYSVGLFLDQRDNRRRFLTGHVAANFPLYSSVASAVLNVFAYTCAFSVCAALAGARTVSLDLSKKYLAWGQRNFTLNGLDPAQHDFIYGDAFDWLNRLRKKQRRFEVIVLDPPTFSQSKESGVFRAEKDFGRLVAAALPLLQAGGILLASTNAAGLAPEKFLAVIHGAIHHAGRRLLQSHYVPQPPDFPISRAEPAYLKTVWLKVD